MSDRRVAEQQLDSRGAEGTVHRETSLIHAGRDWARSNQLVNPPVVHASTVLFGTLDELERSARQPWEGRKLYYGRAGTPTTWALEDAIREIDGSAACVLCPSGINAIAVAFSALLRTGDRVLVSDAVYGPTRTFCDQRLVPNGIEVIYFDPLAGADIERLMDPRTRMVYLESPGSLTFEVQDVPAIAAAARARGVLTVLDNTWATPLYFRAFEHGVDISIQALTKYIAGHADCMLGSVSCRSEELACLLRKYTFDCGLHAAPDDCFLALRGLRTLALRLRRHWDTGLRLACWLAARPEVRQIVHPGFPGSAGHELWRRDFLGASGLFAFRMCPTSRAAMQAMFDHLSLFGMGFSWGAFESLIIPVHPAAWRTATMPGSDGQFVRVHAGLEDPDDLIADLDAAFERRAKAEAARPAAAD